MRNIYALNLTLIFIDSPYEYRRHRAQFGFDSPQYRNAARHADIILSNYIPAWIEQGYQILITSDHGMNNDRSHGGTLPEECLVPLFVVGSQFSHQPAILSKPRFVEPFVVYLCQLSR